MAILNYCVDCQRVFKSNDKCEYCNSTKIKELRKGTSVNVIGTKNKGQILKIKDNEVSLILITEAKERVVKEFNVDALKKIL